MRAITCLPWFLSPRLRAGLAALALVLSLDVPASADDPPTHTLRVIRQGSEIEFLGEIDYGSAVGLEEILAQNPKAKVLHLNSPGGQVDEADRMAASVEKRGMTTTVDEFCVSACTLVFLAGQQRLIAPKAQVGFHRPWVPDMSEAEMAIIIQRDRDFMKGRGISPWFIDKAYATPNSSVWYPTVTEMTSAKVIDGVTDKYVIEVGKFSSALPQEGMALQEFFNAVQQRSPSAFKTLHQYLLTAVTSAGGASFDARFSTYLYAFMAHAENRALVGVVQVQAGLLTRLAAGDPDTCYAMLNPEEAAVSDRALLKVLTIEDLRRLDFVLMRAATNGANNYLTVPSEDEVTPAFHKALLELQHNHPEDLITMKTPHAASHAAICRAHAHFFSAVAKLPPDDQGLVARFLFGQQARDIDLGAGPGTPVYSSSSAPSTTLHPHPDK